MAVDNFKPTLWEGALLHNFHSVSIADVMCTKPSNVNGTNDLPDEIAPAVKELVLIRFNRDGAEGISSESQSSGGSTTYSDALPDHVRRIIRKYRKLPR